MYIVSILDLFFFFIASSILSSLPLLFVGGVVGKCRHQFCCSSFRTIYTLALFRLFYDSSRVYMTFQVAYYVVSCEFLWAL
ncbi:hypothetical protein C2G38_2120810 [Gigaspora rosea]|uniref:Uncharacterized protein n=1 Tax=Gigaspora rosea TaxID=44941 RepID=A0A397U268_9GLOM|nr:hypothetical protein C2G38_2120810 [Gigaspora rosea]